MLAQQRAQSVQRRHVSDLAAVVGQKVLLRHGRAVGVERRGGHVEPRPERCRRVKVREHDLLLRHVEQRLRVRVERVVEGAVRDKERLRPCGVGRDHIGVKLDIHTLGGKVKARVGGKVADIGIVILKVALAQVLLPDLIEDSRGERVDERFAEYAVGRGLRVKRIESEELARRQIEVPCAENSVWVRAAVIDVGLGGDAQKTVGLVGADGCHLARPRTEEARLILKGIIILARVLRDLCALRMQGIQHALHLGVEGVAHSALRRLCSLGAVRLRRCVRSKGIVRRLQRELRQLVFFAQQQRTVVGKRVRLEGQRRAEDELQLFPAGGIRVIGIRAAGVGRRAAGGKGQRQRKRQQQCHTLLHHIGFSFQER